MPGEFESILTKLQGKLGKQTIRRASTINRPRPKREVQQINIFNEFNRRNPKADGGRINFDSGGSPLQQLRQSLVDDLMYKFPSMKEEDMQMVVRDINLDMSPEEAQASMSSNFTKIFGSLFSTGGRVGYATAGVVDPDNNIKKVKILVQELNKKQLDIKQKMVF